MASYFWVGGAGTWDGGTKTNWALSSGGVGGQGPPTASDTVTFDGSSGLIVAQTVVINTGAVCGGCTITGLLGRGVRFLFAANITWSAGTYSFQGNDDATPILLLSNIVGVQRTLTINGTHGTHSNVCFEDIALAGTAGTLTGTRIGDMLGNSGITFDGSTTQTWTGAFGGGTSANWSDVSKWTSHVPLPQDDVVFTGGATGSNTIILDTAILGRSIDASAVSGSGSVTFNRQSPQAITNYCHGSFVLNSKIATGGSPANTLVFQGRGSHNLNWGNFQISFSCFMRAVTGTYTLTANWAASSSAMSIGSGTLDANGFTINARGTLTVASDNSSTLTSTFLGRGGNHIFGGNNLNSGFSLGTGGVASGTGTWTIQGWGTCWSVAAAAAANFTPPPLLLFTDATVNSKTFSAGGSVSYGIVRVTPGTGGFIIVGQGNKFQELSVSGGGASLTIPAGKTQLVSGGILTLRGQPGNPLSVVSGTPGSQATIVVADGTSYNIGDNTLSGDINLVLPGGAANPVGHRVSVLNR